MNPNPSPSHRFQKGKSGNPGGKLKDGVLAFAKKHVPNTERTLAGHIKRKGKTHAEAVVEAAFRKAMAGDSKVLPYLLDRIYGKVTQPLEVTGLEDLAGRIAAARQRVRPAEAQQEQPKAELVQ